MDSVRDLFERKKHAKGMWLVGLVICAFLISSIALLVQESGRPELRGEAVAEKHLDAGMSADQISDIGSPTNGAPNGDANSNPYLDNTEGGGSGSPANEPDEDEKANNVVEYEPEHSRLASPETGAEE